MRKALKDQLEETKQEQDKPTIYTHEALTVYRDAKSKEWTLGSVKVNPHTGETGKFIVIITSTERSIIEFEFRKNTVERIFENKINNN